MAIFKRHSLKAGNNRTRAAELTLRESIYPLCLVTILFFLWVGACFRLFRLLNTRVSSIDLTRCEGLLVRASGYPQQALSGSSEHHSIAKFRSAGCLLRRLPARFAGTRELDPATLWLQSRIHLGPLPVRHRIAHRVAVPSIPFFRGLLRRYFHHRQRSGISRDGCESVSHGLRSAEVQRAEDQLCAGIQWNRDCGCACVGLLRFLHKCLGRPVEFAKCAVDVSGDCGVRVPARWSVLPQSDS